ncbi:uncharacterized protein BP01DRAFT_357793 [Aspergillus saccharolyticus JOP 1030-1]|uniref:Uncharacterized protein n=1 Tax=Aspergillus saccharolyticus JOP 1030-1 TaxID=1450539 RepID=A0A318ZB14_9EURO|nr:hypothetical protein BP01DRAFT_357793 [Aspergillus saccharolyticus JOP 1030-1]PYH44489.1 hypothetical protein BP01DRAFT_357793 [Aspergillus saccharolyticus JOP 1030-1]
MAPFRNFLSRKSAAPSSVDITTHDNTSTTSRLSIDGQRSTPLVFRQSFEKEPPEYKLSVVDANGAYLPPSPPEKQSFWPKYPGSPKSSHHRDLVNENEPFSISRESFDSYRRSFDISARSPVCYTDALPSRTSLDSRVSRMTSPPSTLHTGLCRQPESMEEEQFEDVGLDDENETKPKRKSIFSRFGDFTSSDSHNSSNSKSSTLGFHIPGRKRGQSNGASELGPFKSPPASAGSEINDA